MPAIVEALETLRFLNLEGSPQDAIADHCARTSGTHCSGRSLVPSNQDESASDTGLAQQSLEEWIEALSALYAL
jgi:pyridoxine 5'-phosphate synthase PdxJ